MTKKEQEQVRELKRRLSTLAALRWTEEVEADVPPPEYSPRTGLTKGWLPLFNRVDKAVSSSVYHSVGSHEVEEHKGSWSQGPRSLYSTKLLALKALRYEVESRCAEELSRIDLMIAVEKGASDDPA